MSKEVERSGGLTRRLLPTGDQVGRFAGGDYPTTNH